MESRFERLTALAFKQGPAADANQLINEVRASVQERFGASHNYEVVLTGRSPEYLLRELAPRLALYVRSKRYRVERCAPVFLSVFLDETIYFMGAQDFFEDLRRSQGLDPRSFATMARGWEETGRFLTGALPPARPPGDDIGGGEGESS